MKDNYNLTDRLLHKMVSRWCYRICVSLIRLITCVGFYINYLTFSLIGLTLIRCHKHSVLDLNFYCLFFYPTLLIGESDINCCRLEILLDDCHNYRKHLHFHNYFFYSNFLRTVNFSYLGYQLGIYLSIIFSIPLLDCKRTHHTFHWRSDMPCNWYQFQRV